MGTGALGDLYFILLWPCNVHSFLPFLMAIIFTKFGDSLYYTFCLNWLYNLQLQFAAKVIFPLLLVANHYGQYNTPILWFRKLGISLRSVFPSQCVKTWWDFISGLFPAQTHCEKLKQGYPQIKMVSYFQLNSGF